jgi:hypothetical protein
VYAAFTGSGRNNTTSGYFSFTGSGYLNTTSGACSFTGSGRNNTTSGVLSSIVGGFCNTNSCTGSFIGGGYCNTADACLTSISGGICGCAYRYGQRSWANGYFAASGDSQQVDLTLRGKTTDGNQTNIYLNGGAVAGTTKISVPSGKVMLVNILTLGVKSDGSAVASSYDYVIIKNVGGTTTIAHQSNIKQHYDAGGYAITIAANDTDDTLEIKVTGLVGETLRWTSWVTGVELAYGT